MYRGDIYLFLQGLNLLEHDLHLEYNIKKETFIEKISKLHIRAQGLNIKLADLLGPDVTHPDLKVPL